MYECAQGSMDSTLLVRTAPLEISMVLDIGSTDTLDLTGVRARSKLLALLPGHAFENQGIHSAWYGCNVM